MVLLFWLTGCHPASRRDAFAAVERTIRTSVERGKEQSERQRSYRVPARYNPARCPCPDYEVFVYGRWVRVDLEGPPPVMSKLSTFEEAKRQRRLLTVDGTLSHQHASAKGYPVFQIRHVEASKTR